jgi:hypothetical protein
MERTRRYSLNKHPHYEVRCSNRSLKSGEKIRGWWIYDGSNDFCTAPDPSHMNEFGWHHVFYLQIIMVIKFQILRMKLN